jgi:hypothetical protein
MPGGTGDVPSLARRGEAEVRAGRPAEALAVSFRQSPGEAKSQESIGLSAGRQPRGVRTRRADEDENLGGAGSLERGQPILRFFDTQEQREPTRKRDCPELQVRSTGGRRRAHPARGTQADRGSDGARPAEGRAPGRRKPRRAGSAREGEIPTRPPHRPEGSSPCSEAPAAKADGRQSQEGRGRREAARSPARAGPGGRNPGSAPGGDTGETAAGARRRGRQERRGRNRTRRRYLREWWLVAERLRCGGEEPRESGAPFIGAGIAGSDSGAG